MRKVRERMRETEKEQRREGEEKTDGAIRGSTPRQMTPNNALVERK